MMTLEGATDAEVFETFLERVLVRKLRPGVVLDNVGAHRTDNVHRIVEAAGASLLYLPPYSPDLNPIEPGRGDGRPRLVHGARSVTPALLAKKAEATLAAVAHLSTVANAVAQARRRRSQRPRAS